MVYIYPDQIQKSSHKLAKTSVMLHCCLQSFLYRSPALLQTKCLPLQPGTPEFNPQLLRFLSKVEFFGLVSVLEVWLFCRNSPMKTSSVRASARSEVHSASIYILLLLKLRSYKNQTLEFRYSHVNLLLTSLPLLGASKSAVNFIQILHAII